MKYLINRYVETLANIYKQATESVKIHDDTPESKTRREVCQGKSISPKLFSAVRIHFFFKLKLEFQKKSPRVLQSSR